MSDHPHSDPGDGRTECEACGKWVFGCTHSCKGIPVTAAAMARYDARCGGLDPAHPGVCPMKKGHPGGCFNDPETDA